jgi:ribosomal protein S18 acetylase RimI-like enzyme
MMEIRYTSNLEGVSWRRVAEIMAAVGWGDRDRDALEQAFRRSSFVRFAWCAEDIVGFGRTIDDGRFYGVICDLVVAPEFQGKGVGSRILRELRESMDRFLFVTLTAAPGKDRFYVDQGWKRQRSAFIWPRGQRQALDHACQEE